MSLATNGRGLRINIHPLNGLLMLIFEWKVPKGVISPPIKRFIFYFGPKLLEKIYAYVPNSYVHSTIFSLASIAGKF